MIGRWSVMHQITAALLTDLCSMYEYPYQIVDSFRRLTHGIGLDENCYIHPSATHLPVSSSTYRDPSSQPQCSLPQRNCPSIFYIYFHLFSDLSPALLRVASQFHDIRVGKGAWPFGGRASLETVRRRECNDCKQCMLGEKSAIFSPFANMFVPMTAPCCSSVRSISAFEIPRSSHSFTCSAVSWWMCVTIAADFDRRQFQRRHWRTSSITWRYALLLHYQDLAPCMLRVHSPLRIVSIPTNVSILYPKRIRGRTY